MDAMCTTGMLKVTLALQEAARGGVERLEAQLLLLHALGRTAQARA